MTAPTAREWRIIRAAVAPLTGARRQAMILDLLAFLRAEDLSEEAEIELTDRDLLPILDVTAEAVEVCDAVEDLPALREAATERRPVERRQGRRRVQGVVRPVQGVPLPCYSAAAGVVRRVLRFGCGPWPDPATRQFKSSHSPTAQATSDGIAPSSGGVKGGGAA